MLTIILLASLLTDLLIQDAKAPQPVRQNSDPISSACSQPASERDALIREAERNQFVVRRVEFLGNAHTSDYVLRRRMINLTEGDVFTRGNLVKSLASVSRLKRIIHPVKLSDVTIHLDRAENLVDMVICFKEKRRSHRRGSAIPAAPANNSFNRARVSLSFIVNLNLSALNVRPANSSVGGIKCHGGLA